MQVGSGEMPVADQKLKLGNPLIQSQSQHGLPADRWAPSPSVLSQMAGDINGKV